jgi:hypothetical protein
MFRLIHGNYHKAVNQQNEDYFAFGMQPDVICGIGKYQ